MYMREGPDRAATKAKTETHYIDNLHLYAISAAIRENKDTPAMFESVAKELLRDLATESEDAAKADFLGKALMTLVHLVVHRRDAGEFREYKFER